MSKHHPIIAGLALVLACTIMPSICLASHPNHVSSAEVNWNQKTGNFEVALCVWPADLEKALANDQSKIIDLDKVENLDEMIKSYIEKKFLIRRAQSEPSTGRSNQHGSNSVQAIRWVGHERDLKAAWLYFEVEGEKLGSQWTIENRVFFEMNEDQLNQIETTIGMSTEIVTCKIGTSRHSIDTSNTSVLGRSFRE